MKNFFILIALCMGLTTSMQAQITSTTEPTVENPDAKYLVSIPQEADGHVYLERVMTLPEGSNIDEVYAKLGDWVDRCMKDERINSFNKVEVDEPYTYAMMVRQDVVFSKALLALDKAEYQYLLKISLKDNQMILQIRRISFFYNGDNPDRKTLHRFAEDYIADKYALNKRGDKLVRGNRKYRVATINLIDEYESSLKMAFWIK